MNGSSAALLAGIERTLLSTLGVAALALALGVALGGAAGRRAGAYDGALHRLVELAGALPAFVALPLLARHWSPVWCTVLVLGVHHGLRLACIYRNETWHTSALPFVRSVRALGMGPAPAHRRHVLPLIVPPLLVGMLLVLPKVVGVEAALRLFELDHGPSCGAAVLDAAGTFRGALVAPLLGATLALGVLAERLIVRILREGS